MSETPKKSSWKDTCCKMSVDEVKNLVDRINTLKMEVNPQNFVQRGDRGNEVIASTRPDMIQDVASIKAEIRRLENILDKDDQLILRGADKDKALTEIAEIEIVLRKDIPSKNDQWQVSRNGFDFEHGVTKVLHWQQINAAAIARWKELKRRLEPDNPFADKIELLMPGFNAKKE